MGTPRCVITANGINTAELQRKRQAGGNRRLLDELGVTLRYADLAQGLKDI